VIARRSSLLDCDDPQRPESGEVTLGHRASHIERKRMSRPSAREFLPLVPMKWITSTDSHQMNPLEELTSNQPIIQFTSDEFPQPADIE
jgi:hypothetical protein